MIEKITTEYPDFDDLKYTVNQLVDAVNELQTTLDNYTKRFRELGDENMKKITQGFKNLQDPDAGTSIVLGANCPKCGIGNSDIKLWQELIRTHKALDVAVDALKKIKRSHNTESFYRATAELALEQITALEQKDVK